MSGHNKWSKIKHKKGAEDAKKSKDFSKLVRLITTEVKLSNGDIESPGVRLALEKAKKLNMPSSTIDKAIKQGKEKDATLLQKNTYEGYGPQGVALIIETLTDNKNRSAAEVRHVFSKLGYSLSTPGAAMWNFNKDGIDYVAKTSIPLSETDKESLGKLKEELLVLEDVQEVYSNEK